MRLRILGLLSVLLAQCGYPQSSIENTLKRLNKGSVPYVQPTDLHQDSTAVLLDTRKKEEFNVSALPGAHWVGYSSFELQEVKDKWPDRDTPIVVYCSVGVRSEDIGEKLQKAGYTNVRNLYGGLFQWTNEELPLVNPANQETTRKVHAYNKRWGQLLTKGEKVYE